MSRPTKFVFVTGGVVSSIGKGRYVVFRDVGEKESGFYSAETGKRVFTVPRYFQLGWVVGPRVLGLQRMPDGKDFADTKLTAYDLTTGKVAWNLSCHPSVGR